jgi:hypothetical protein
VRWVGGLTVGLYTLDRHLYVDVVSIIQFNFIESIIELTPAQSINETVTAELGYKAQLDAAIAANPPAHRLNPSRDEWNIETSELKNEFEL